MVCICSVDFLLISTLIFGSSVVIGILLFSLFIIGSGITMEEFLIIFGFTVEIDLLLLLLFIFGLGITLLELSGCFIEGFETELLDSFSLLALIPISLLSLSSFEDYFESKFENIPNNKKNNSITIITAAFVFI